MSFVIKFIFVIHIHIGNVPVAENDIQMNEIIQDPVYDVVRKESSQVLSPNQVEKGPDPVYQDLSFCSKEVAVSDEVNTKSNTFYQILTTDQVKKAPDPAYHDLLLLHSERVTIIK